MDTLTHEDCLDHGIDPCKGNVEYHITPGGSRGFPRCDHHWDRRLARWETSIEKYADSDVEPDWFDPSYAGEHWSDDY